MRFLNLSATIAPTSPDVMPFERVEIRSTGHDEGAEQVEALFRVPFAPGCAQIDTSVDHNNPKRERGYDSIHLADASGWCDVCSAQS
ncbi:MAG: hypothetical protein ACLQGP_21515 [Isosphaeraceae bacterium]